MLIRNIHKVLVVVFLMSSNFLYAGQGDQYLAKLSVDAANEKVLIQFTTANGFSCEDIKILAGTDSNNLEEIHLFPGICGSEDNEVFYAHTWGNPVYNQPVYIRIDLGLFGQTRALSVTVKRISANESQVVPNPVTSESRLIFDLGPGEKADIHIYGSKGDIVKEMDGQTTGEIRINAIELKAGIYYYVIDLAGRTLRGKFSVTTN